VRDAIFISIFCWLASGPALAQSTSPTTRPAATDPPGGRADFAPGVVIDWSELHVELEGRVVLQSGPLELAVCSPRTREHESIVTIQARPLDVYNALGLIGLTPGRPFTYDEKNDRWLAPQGDFVEVNVHYVQQGRPKTVNLWNWMADAESGKPVEPREWVFCGSRRFTGGTFGADADGTVICVVDFDTALIGLADAHSADNAALWVQANPRTVPPEGTPCTLLIRSSPAMAMEIQLSAGGDFTWNDQPLSRKKLEDVVRRRLAICPRISARILPYPENNPDKEGLSETRLWLRKLGIAEVDIVEGRRPTRPPIDSTGEPRKPG
jgi:hypothetical protein